MTPDLLQRHPIARILLTLLTVVVGMYAINLIWSALTVVGDVILLFFLAWVVCFILEPVSLFLQRHGIQRVVAVSLIYVALLLVISGVIVLTVPTLQDESKLLAQEVTTALSPANLTALGTSATSSLRGFGLSQRDAQNIVTQISNQIPGWIGGQANNAVNATTSLFGSILGVLFDAFLVLILSYYMMLDGDRLVERFVQLLPPGWVPDVRLFQRSVEQIFGGYFRAQMIIATLYGTITWVTLLCFGQANGLLVAIISGVIMLVPFIGAPLAILPPVLLVLLQAPSKNLLIEVLLLVAVLGVAQNVVMQVIAPRVMGTTMGIHPLILFAALLVGAKEAGVWGACFAGPVVGVTLAMLQVFYERFRRSSPLFSVPRDAEEVESATAPLSEPALAPRAVPVETPRLTPHDGPASGRSPAAAPVGTAPLAPRPFAPLSGWLNRRHTGAQLPNTPQIDVDVAPKL